ncbi:MAG: DUF4142 domain-containing protein [Ferruginibacter sp.]
MKLSIKTLTILFAAATMYACNNSGNTGTGTNSDSATGSDKPSAMDTSNSMTDTSHSAMSSTTTSSPEQDFLNYAIPANAKELIWLKAGLAQGTLKDIKEHSTMMIKDHKKLEATVKEFMAKKPSMSMPALDTANTVNINDKTGEGWDKAWTDKMVDDHTALLDKLKKAKEDVKDADLNKIITNTIPVVASHLAMTKMIQDKLNKK